MPDVTVTVDDEHLGALEGVAEALRSEGMQVAQVLGDLGIISGSVADDVLPRLAAVPGVSSVDLPMSFQLPPPDADVQ